MIMTYRMPCPKCCSRSTCFSECKDRWTLPFPQNVEYSCYTCGLKLLGEKAVELAQKALKGKAELEKVEAAKKRAEEEKRHAAAEAALEKARLKKTADARKAESLERKRARDREYRRKLRAVRAESDECFWVECSNKARQTSKYCSRACSNKNSRARAKARKAAKVT